MSENRVTREGMAAGFGVDLDALSSQEWLDEHRRIQAQMEERIADALAANLSMNGRAEIHIERNSEGDAESVTFAESGPVTVTLPTEGSWREFHIEWLTVEPCDGNESESEHDDQVDAALHAVDTLAPVRRSGRSPYLTGSVSPSWRLRYDPPVRIIHLNWPAHQVGDVDVDQTDLLSPDVSSMQFDLERTEVCWRDDCGAESDPESETGLCAGCRTDLRSRWTE